MLYILRRPEPFVLCKSQDLSRNVWSLVQSTNPCSLYLNKIWASCQKSVPYLEKIWALRILRKPRFLKRRLESTINQSLCSISWQDLSLSWSRDCVLYLEKISALRIVRKPRSHEKWLESTINQKPSSLSLNNKCSYFRTTELQTPLTSRHELTRIEQQAQVVHDISHMYFKNSRLPTLLEFFSWGKDKAEYSDWTSKLRSRISISSDPAVAPLWWKLFNPLIVAWQVWTTT